MRKVLVALVTFVIGACGSVDTDTQVSVLQQACRERQKVCICHVPPGNPTNAREICIAEPAWEAHKRNHHLDYEGDCVEKCYKKVVITICEYKKVCDPCSKDSERRCEIKKVCKRKRKMIEVPCEEPPVCDAGPCDKPRCGDEECNGDETCETCPQDCGACPPPPPVCGDQMCNGDETCRDCPSDCGSCPPPPPTCGDEVCNGEETCDTCPLDCGVCPPVCGDENCDANESCGTCPQDCGICPPPPPFCGDENCDANETCIDCATDCGLCPPPPPYCGDEKCDPAESCETCMVDCGSCPPPPPICGDEECHVSEDCATCTEDCGVCPPPPPTCGDGTCDATETCTSCSLDCGVCPPVCGDAVCEGPEDCASDCPPPPPPVCEDCPTPEPQPEPQPEPEDPDTSLVGGGGCSTSGTVGSTGWLTFFGVLLVIGLVLRRQRLLAVIVALFLIVMTSAAADAQTKVPFNNFKMAPTHSDYWSTHTGTTLNHLQPAFRALYDYSHKPLQLRDNTTGKRIADVLDYRHNLQLSAAIGLFDRFQISLALPVVLEQGEDDLSVLGYGPNDGLSGGVGDLRLDLKATVYARDILNIAVIVRGEIPTAQTSKMIGSHSGAFAPSVALSADFANGISLAGNVGINVSDTRTLRPTATQAYKTGVDLTASFGVRAPIWKNRIDVVSDIFGSMSLRNIEDEQMNLEWLTGLRGRIWKGLYADIGAGPGLAPGVGTPDFRVFGGFGWTWGCEAEVKTEEAILVPVVIPVEKPRPEPKPAPAPVVKKNTIVLPSVFFDTDKDTVMLQSLPTIGVAAKLLRDNPHVTRIRVEGHADHRASDAYNMDLSRRRAQNVIEELVILGVDRSRLSLKAYGESAPRASNATSEGMAINRRVDLMIIDVQ